MLRLHSLRHAALACCLIPVIGVSAASAADVFVVHGIPGEDFDLPSELTVDIAVNGDCALPGTSFGAVVGPIDLPPGSYDIDISLADEANPCGGDVAVTGKADVALGTASIIIAHLDQNGGPAITRFSSKTAPVADDQARLTVYHTAAAPAVDLRLRQSGGGRVAAVQDVTNGDQTFPADVPEGSYDALVSAASGRPGNFNDPIAEIPVTLNGATATAVFAIGSLENGTSGVIPVAVIP